MAKKVDYSKVEKEVGEALIKMQIEQLQQGKPLESSRAIEYYGLGEHARPVQEDPVEKLLAEEAAKESGTIEEDLDEDEISSAHDTLLQVPPRKVPTQRVQTAQKIDSKEQFEAPPEELFLLRRHIFWMKQQGIQDRYTRLGTTQAEVFALKKKGRLTDEDKLRIKTLLKKALQVKEELTKGLGLTSDEALIEREKKRHKTKRFNVREKWLPL